MPASTQEIFNYLKKNGFNMSLSELEKILPILVNEGFIQREMPSLLEWTKMK